MKVKAFFTFILTGLALILTESRAMDSQSSKGKSDAELEQSYRALTGHNQGAEARAMDGVADTSVAERCQATMNLYNQAQIIAARLPNERCSPESKVSIIVTIEKHKLDLEKIANHTKPTQEILDLLDEYHKEIVKTKAILETAEEGDAEIEKDRVRKSKKCVIL